jgi:hypothetical protein
MNVESVSEIKLEWEKPCLIILNIEITEFNCLKDGPFNDGDDICNKS